MSRSPAVDLVLVFQSLHRPSKGQLSDEAVQSRAEYDRLVNSLSQGGLVLTARRGTLLGQVLIFIYAPWSKIEQLAQSERRMDFLLGLSTATLPTHTREFTAEPLTASERLRLIHHYVIAARCDGGLGIAPGADGWPGVQSIMALHDPTFNQMWVNTVIRRQRGFSIGYEKLTIMKDHFGETVTLYFAFLSFYTMALIFPSIVGLIFFVSGRIYHPLYSVLVVVWAITFVEWWKIYERILSVRWGTHGFNRVEQRRVQFHGEEESNFPWWRRELRVLAFLPVILVFTLLLVIIITAIFILEEFIIHNYDGPGQTWLSFSPTILLASLIPTILSCYQSSAMAMTNWENHFRHSSHEYSLTLKTCALSALVAYSGVALTAFLYVPFHGQIMTFLRTTILDQLGMRSRALAENLRTRTTIEPSRVQDQMITFAISTQIFDYWFEYILPFVMRKVESTLDGLWSFRRSNNEIQPVNETEDLTEEREFMKQVHHQIKLPEYTTFEDYDEMVIQFGFVAAWSVIWTITPLMSFLNNWVEIRGDIIKIMNHTRRPIPERIESIGPWIEALSIITWLGAMSNSALVYTIGPQAWVSTEGVGHRGKIQIALLIVLLSSHGYLLVRAVVHHILLRLLWKGTSEEQHARHADREVKRMYLQALGSDSEKDNIDTSSSSLESTFWSRGEDVFGEKED